MTLDVHPLYILRQAKCTVSDMDAMRPTCQNVHMTYKARHFLREWRDFRGLTLEQVAERVEQLGSQWNHISKDGLIYPESMTHVTLSRIETGKQPYKQQLLEILAEIYGTIPASLIMRDPSRPDAIHSIWEQIPESKRQEALDYLSYIVERKVS